MGLGGGHYFLFADVRDEGFGQRDRAVFLLVDLEERYQGAAYGQRGAVEGMQELGAPAVFAVADA